MLGLTTLFLSLASAGTTCPALETKGSALVGKPGHRRAALVVGVGTYATAKDDAAIELPGATEDARHVRDLLVDTFGFPARNVCVLTDADATRERWFAAYERLFQKVKSGDSVVVYFAGHGSQTPGGAETFVLHDSRTTAGDVPSSEVEARLAATYRRTTDITVLVDASHVGGPNSRGPSTVTERWLPPVPGSATPEGSRPPLAETLPKLVWLHAAPSGMPALERDGRGVFTTGLVHALRARPHADWGQILHDVTRWTAALHSWQRPSGDGDLDRTVWSPKGPATTWSVTDIHGDRVRMRGPSQPGFSEGAVVSMVAGSTVAQIQIDEVENGKATGTVLGDATPKSAGIGAPVVVEVPGRDLTSITVSFQGPTRWMRDIDRALSYIVDKDAVLKETVRFVERGGDYIVRPGPDDTVDIVGADGVRRNRLPYGSLVEQGVEVAETLGLYARQATLLALSGEVPATYPNNMFEVRILPYPGRPGCERNPYVPAERPAPWARVPMCNAVQLAIDLVEQPERPLHLGIAYLGGNGNIETWPPRGKTVTLTDKGDRHVQPLGWVTPPLHTPDRILVFGTHRPVDWSRIEAKAPMDQITRSLGAGDFFVAAVAGTRTRGAFVRSGYAMPVWTASLMSLEVTADTALWSAHERDTQATCHLLREAACARAD